MYDTGGPLDSQTTDSQVDFAAPGATGGPLESQVDPAGSLEMSPRATVQDDPDALAMHEENPGGLETPARGETPAVVDDPAAAYAAKVKELEEELWSREQLAEELDALMTKLNPGQSRFNL